MPARRQHSSHARRARRWSTCITGSTVDQRSVARNARGVDQNSVSKGASAAVLQSHPGPPAQQRSRVCRGYASLCDRDHFCEFVVSMLHVLDRGSKGGHDRPYSGDEVERVGQNGTQAGVENVWNALPLEREPFSTAFYTRGGGSRLIPVYYYLCDNEAQRESHLRHASLADPCRHIAYLRVHSCHKQAACR